MLLRIVSQEVAMLRERKEKKRKKATNYVEKQTLGMHTQHPGTSGNKRRQHRIAQGSSVYIEQFKKSGEHLRRSIVTDEVDGRPVIDYQSLRLLVGGANKIIVLL